MNKDQAEGKWEQTKGAVKDKTGELLGDKDLEAEGEAQRGIGKAQEKVGDVRDTAGKAVKDLGDKIQGR